MIRPADAPAAGPWLPRWRAAHGRAAVGVVAGAALLAAALPAAGGAGRVSLGVQLAGLAALVAVFGVPHGALDPLVARTVLAPRLAPRLPRGRWEVAFHAAYLALAGAVLVGWWRLPAATLALFLAASAAHFGAGDVEAGGVRAPAASRWAEALARGGAVVAVPALAHPDEVTRLFAWVAAGARPEAVARVTAGAAAAARWAVLPAAAAFAGWHAWRGWRAWRGARRRPAAASDAGPHLAAAAELVAVPLLFAAAPPLVAFALYFCALHSARHAFALAAALDPRDPRRAWGRFARAALPATLATLAAAGAAWLALRAGRVPAAAAGARVLFAGLAALTAPHMLLAALAGEPGEPRRGGAGGA